MVGAAAWRSQRLPPALPQLALAMPLSAPPCQAEVAPTPSAIKPQTGVLRRSAVSLEANLHMVSRKLIEQAPGPLRTEQERRLKQSCTHCTTGRGALPETKISSAAGQSTLHVLREQCRCGARAHTQAKWITRAVLCTTESSTIVVACNCIRFFRTQWPS